MKKMIEKIGLLLFVNFVFMIGVNAATLEFDGKSSLTINQDASEKVSIKLGKLEQEEKIERVEFEIVYNSSLLTLKANDNENGYAQVNNNNKITILDPTDDKTKPLTEGVIYSFNITNNSPEDKTDEVIQIKNIKINGEDKTDEVKPINLVLKKTVTTTTRKPNTSAKVTDFSVSNATVKPAFSADVKEYKIYTNKDTIRQVALLFKYEESGVVMSSECTLGCTADANKLTLVTGKNEATFTFTSEDGKNTEIYKFTIYRGETTDGSNLLSALEITDVKLNEEFNKSNLDYTATVPFETESVEINPTPEDEKANIKIKGNEKLEVGENVVTITVTSAETTEKKIYNIVITREEFKPKEEQKTVVAPKIEKKKSNNILPLIIIIIVSLLIIGLAAYFIFFKKDKKKKDKNKKTDNDAISVKEKDSILKNPIIDEDKEPTSVEEALADLMKTKETKLDE